MNAEEFKRRLRENAKEIAEMVRTRAPKVVGVKASNFFRENFRKGGYMDNGFHAWPITKRQLSGEPGAGNKYSPLLSKRSRLFSAIQYKPMDAAVEIYNDTPYAEIHNEGGVTHPTVTKEMRKYFWRMYYKNGAADGGPRADKYKWMALTDKSHLTIRIPQRKFIYNSPEVEALVSDTLKAEVKKILLR